VISLLDQLVGKPVVLNGVGCNLNLPGSRVQHYHIDGEYEPDVLVVNIALVDTNLENGAIDLVPGSSKKFYRYYDFVTEGLARTGTRCSMRRGDVLIRSAAVWHRGMPNLTAVPRPMMALGYQPPATVRARSANFSAHGGRVTFTPNFYDTSIKGRAKEFMFVRVPFVHSTLRFVKSMMEERRAS
jgi:ectoine hydroxylase-related dioxygenase (phytanoyl-CoA dioxygenase family)